tara:strand:+ start:677 stop:988 length:312 start_codon:yes stop_codon:yes gene_type:complete
MAHPNEYLKKQSPTRIVLVDENQSFTGNFYAFTPIVLGATTSFVVQTPNSGNVQTYSSDAFKDVAKDTNITLPAAVGVTIFGSFSKFTGTGDSKVILYLEEQD